MICLGTGYSVKLIGYDTWSKYVMAIIIFKHIYIVPYILRMEHIYVDTNIINCITLYACYMINQR